MVDPGNRFFAANVGMNTTWCTMALMIHQNDSHNRKLKTYLFRITVVPDLVNGTVLKCRLIGVDWVNFARHYGRHNWDRSLLKMRESL